MAIELRHGKKGIGRAGAHHERVGVLKVVPRVHEDGNRFVGQFELEAFVLRRTDHDPFSVKGASQQGSLVPMHEAPPPCLDAHRSGGKPV